MPNILKFSESTKGSPGDFLFLLYSFFTVSVLSIIFKI